MHFLLPAMIPVGLALGGILGGTAVGAVVAGTVRSPLAPVGERFVPAPDGIEFHNPAWLRNSDEIVVNVKSRSEYVHEPHLYAIRADGSVFRQLSLTDGPGCTTTRRQIPTALPDGRLGYAERCYERDPSSPSRGRERTALMVYSPVPGSGPPLQRLVPYELTFEPRSFSFSAEMQLGVLREWTGRSEEVWRLYPQQRERFDVPLVRKPRLDLAPDGRTLVVVGEVRDELAFGLSSSRWLLLHVPFEGGEVRQFPGAFGDAAQPRWSPTGRWLLVYEGVGRNTSDLWLIHMATQRRFHLLHGRFFRGADWSPDERAIVVAVGTPGTAEPQERPVGLHILELPDLEQFAR